MNGLGRPLAVNHRILPGYRLSLGFTLLYLTVLVGIPLAACLAKVSSLTAAQLLAARWTERARAATTLPFGVSFAAAGMNVPLARFLAWILVDSEFPLNEVLDSLTI